MEFRAQSHLREQSAPFHSRSRRGILTCQRPNCRVVDERENQEKGANRPGGARSHWRETDEAHQEQGYYDPGHAPEVDCSASESVDQGPGEDSADESNGVLRVYQLVGPHEEDGRDTHKTKGHIKGLGSRQTSLLEEVNRICLQHRSAHLLGDPGAYCNLRAAEVRALETLHVAHAGGQFFLESIGLGK